MKIVQAVGWYLPESIGGTELYVASLSNQLRRAGHEVLIAAPDHEHDRERCYEHDGIRVFRYPVSRTVSRAQARSLEPVPGSERFHRWLAEVRADIVHVHTFVPGLGVPEIEAAAASGATVIVTSHAASLGFVCERGTMLQWGRTLCDGRADRIKCSACALQHRGVPEAVADLLARIPLTAASRLSGLPGAAGTVLGFPELIEQNRRTQTRMFATVAAFVVLSEWARAVMVANGAPAGKVVVNRLGIAGGSDRQWRQRIASRAPATRPLVAGFVGRAEPIKGLDDAVRAIRALPPETAIRLRAVVLARPADRPFLDACRRIAAGDPRISFEPGVDHAAIPSLLASLDVLLCPSRAVEGGPTIALEAMAAGTPVIGSAVPALNEIIRDQQSGALHAPGDWKALAAQLTRTCADPPGTIGHWRAALPVPRTVADVAADYERLYEGARDTARQQPLHAGC